MTHRFRRSIVGSRGFVGQTLNNQQSFDGQFSRGNMHELANSRHEFMIFASAPAKKWLANSQPEADKENLAYLLRILAQVDVEKFVLVSTVDVFESPEGVNESSEADASAPNHYGANRLDLEHEVRLLFPDALILRLPGLVGSGLQKNALYDLKHNNDIHKLNGASTFQFYPMANLSRDLDISLGLNANIVHLTAEPVELSWVAREVFGQSLGRNEELAVNYDFQTLYGASWGASGLYQYSKASSLDAILKYSRAAE
jgi:dTDP-4-dehydrorhamnose reductase